MSTNSPLDTNAINNCPKEESSEKQSTAEAAEAKSQSEPKSKSNPMSESESTVSPSETAADAESEPMSEDEAKRIEDTMDTELRDTYQSTVIEGQSGDSSVAQTALGGMMVLFADAYVMAQEFYMSSSAMADEVVWANLAAGLLIVGGSKVLNAAMSVQDRRKGDQSQSQ